MGFDGSDNRTPAEQAADWLVRLQSDQADEADWAAFEGWLAASPENWAAYDRVELLSAEVDARADEMLDALQIPTPKLNPMPAQMRAGLPWPQWAGGGIVLAAAVMAVWVMWPAPPPEVFDAGRGQIREVALRDGTHITLNAASRIQVSIDSRSRRVTMDDGEAAFDVTKDARRPFLISVGDRTIQVVGTAFNVANRNRRLNITVMRGVVEVKPLQGAQGETVRLVRGNQFTHEVGSPLQKLDVVATPENAVSWKKLRLIYDNAPLEEVVVDLNRYFPRPVSVDDGAKSLRFSGVLLVADEDAVLRRLEELLPVAANRTAEAIVLRRRGGAN